MSPISSVRLGGFISIKLLTDIADSSDQLVVHVRYMDCLGRDCIFCRVGVVQPLLWIQLGLSCGQTCRAQENKCLAVLVAIIENYGRCFCFIYIINVWLFGHFIRYRAEYSRSRLFQDIPFRCCFSSFLFTNNTDNKSIHNDIIFLSNNEMVK